jgi:hypothetical protein
MTNASSVFPRWPYLAACLLLAASAFAATDSMNCNTDSPAGHVELTSSDQNTATHLQLSRPIPAQSQIDLDVCSGSVTLVGSKSGALEITVDLGQPSAHLVGDYLEALDITGHMTTIHLHLARALHPAVTIGLPVTISDLDANLARGDLSLAAHEIGGARTINVGYGSVTVQGNDDTYEGLEVNVGMGSLHDHRAGGTNHHLIVSHSYEGSGKGLIQINVGVGHVNLEPSQGKPI